MNSQQTQDVAAALYSALALLEAAVQEQPADPKTRMLRSSVEVLYLAVIELRDQLIARGD